MANACWKINVHVLLVSVHMCQLYWKISLKTLSHSNSHKLTVWKYKTTISCFGELFGVVCTLVHLIWIQITVLFTFKLMLSTLNSFCLKNYISLIIIIVMDFITLLLKFRLILFRCICGWNFSVKLHPVYRLTLNMQLTRNIRILSCIFGKWGGLYYIKWWKFERISLLCLKNWNYISRCFG